MTVPDSDTKRKIQAEFGEEPTHEPDPPPSLLGRPSELPKLKKHTPLQGWPQLQTLVFLVIAAGIYFLLNAGTGDAPLADTEQWVVWRVVAAVGSTLAIGVSVMGAKQFWELTANYPRRDWPIPGMSERLNIVILIVGLATVPWVALNWTVHSVANTSGTEAGLGELVSLWTRLTNCIFAFASFVVIALLQTGALRSVWQAQPNLDQAEQAKFTTTDVLMYGGFLAVMMAALAIPLLAAWQGKAKAFVNAQFPFGNFPFEKDADQGWAPGRELLEKTLHLNVSVLANPLTALSVFTPLIASLLAAFLPELGTS